MLPKNKPKGLNRDRILSYFRRYLESNDRLPTKDVAAARFKVTRQAIMYHVHKLIGEGKLEFFRRGWRFPRK